jgi:adenosylcobinamide-GDP ribazoletransferase
MPLVFIDIKIVAGIFLINVLVFIYFRYFVHKNIGGYTGDVLGALQQFSETSFYVSFLLFSSLL